MIVLKPGSLLCHLAFVLCFVHSIHASFTLDISRDCGANYTGLEGNISSPNFGARDYEADTECTWTVTVPSDMVVRLEFDSIDIEEEQECVFDGVVLYDYYPNVVVNVSNYADNSPYLGSIRFCGSDHYPPMVSKTNKVGIKFYSDSDNEKPGFHLHWAAMQNTGENSFNCSFEQGLCSGWRDLSFPEDHFDWTLNMKETPTADTGPQFDHTVQNKNGKYLYIETSFPRKENDLAMLQTPQVLFEDNQTSACLSFWYHMHGNAIGSLLVAKNEEDYPVRWMQKGEQGGNWMNGKVQLQRNFSSPFKVVFIGIKGSSFQGDIALDDVTLTPGNCAEEIGNIIQGQYLVDFLLGNDTDDVSQPPNPTDIICSADLYRCISGTACVPNIFLCDGQPDCPDHDDEFNCLAVVTPTPNGNSRGTEAVTTSASPSSNDDTVMGRMTTEAPDHDDPRETTRSIFIFGNGTGAFDPSLFFSRFFAPPGSRRRTTPAPLPTNQSMTDPEESRDEQTDENILLDSPTEPSRNSMDLTTTAGAAICLCSKQLTALTLFVAFVAKLLTLR